MNTQLKSKNKLHTILVAFVLLNIIGDVGNVIFWYANPSSQISLVGGTIGDVSMTDGGIVNQLVGPESALMIGSAVLLIVSFVYIIALFGLVKQQKWAALLVIGISVVNRVIAVFLFQFSEAFFFWFAWTIILVIVGFLDYRKLGATSQAQAVTPPQKQPVA